MTDEAVHGMIADERRTLADLLGTFTDEQWSTPSLCAGWTVRDVASHLTLAIDLSLLRVAGVMLRHRFDFDRMTRAEVAADHRSGAELAQALRAGATDRFHPPFMGPAAPLTDLIAHGQDIRRPLAIPRAVLAERARVVLNFLVQPRATMGFVARGRLPGLRFVASDTDWSHGRGPEVQGTAEALIMAMLGRSVVLPELSGPGAEVLAGRVSRVA